VSRKSTELGLEGHRKKMIERYSQYALKENHNSEPSFHKFSVCKKSNQSHHRRAEYHTSQWVTGLGSSSIANQQSELGEDAPHSSYLVRRRHYAAREDEK
jgi:hypothetical protein